MASLKNGVLLKLLHDMINRNDVVEDDRKPALLQIRSIIPVLEEGALWPEKGFFLKVSDLSHTLYVSLPEEQNEMIFLNKLKLGQFMHIQKLEKSYPIPLLVGTELVPGRHSCEGAPEDIVSSTDLMKLLEESSMDSILEKGVILENIIFDNNTKKTFKDILVEWPKSRPSYVDNVISSTSTTCISKRRSWNKSDILGAKEIFDSSIVKHDIRPPSRSHSANVSPSRSIRYDSSDDNSSSKTRRRDVSSTKRLIKNTDKFQASVPKINKELFPNSLCGLVNEKKGADAGISWNSLPSNLVKYGKEVIKQRDIALLVAVDSLQEACAAERSLKSLSTLSEFPSAERDDLQLYADKFFDLQDDLTRTRLIMQSLANISPICDPDTESRTTTNPINEKLNITLQRKKNATTWIKSAISLDLSPCPPTISPVTNKSSYTTTRNSTIPKGSRIIKSNLDISIGIASEKEDQPGWTKGSTLPAANNLVMSLQDECKRLFLRYVEKYVDEVERKSSFMKSDGELAEMMFNVKKVSDWLDVIVNKDVDCDHSSEYLEVEAFGRVRNKIYRLLLKHVERTAIAFQRLNATT